MVKNPLPANAGHANLIPGSGRSPGEGNGNPLQCSCLGNSMNRGAWWATVHGVTKGQDRMLLTEQQHMISRDIVSLVMNSDGVQPRSQVALSAEESLSVKKGQHLPPTIPQPQPMIDG